MLYDYTREHLAITVILTAMFNLNLFVFYGITGTQLQSRVVGVDLSIILAVLYAAVWLLLGIYAWGATQPRKAVETHLPAMASEPG